MLVWLSVLLMYYTETCFKLRTIKNITYLSIYSYYGFQDFNITSEKLLNTVHYKEFK